MTDPRNAYRESAARGASAVGHVVLLYGQIVDDLRNAIQAIEACNIEERTNAINHAMVVVSHLQNSLNFEVGGAVATSLSASTTWCGESFWKLSSRHRRNSCRSRSLFFWICARPGSRWTGLLQWPPSNR